MRKTVEIDSDDALRDSEEEEDDEDYEYRQHKRKKKKKGSEFIIEEAEVDEDAEEDEDAWDDDGDQFGVSIIMIYFQSIYRKIEIHEILKLMFREVYKNSQFDDTKQCQTKLWPSWNV